jgi:hypothetical protein
MVDPPLRGDSNHHPSAIVPSHKIPTPLHSNKSVKFDVMPGQASNNAPGVSPGTKKKRLGFDGTPDSSDRLRKRQRRACDPAFPIQFSPATAQQILQQGEDEGKYGKLEVTLSY